MATNCCYIIVSADGRSSYVGWTNAPSRRIRQHCGQIKGGARATRGRQWHYAARLEGIVDEKHAMQCEWKLKRLSRGKRPAARVAVLVDMLQTLDKWTHNSTVLIRDMQLTLRVKASMYTGHVLNDPRICIVDEI